MPKFIIGKSPIPKESILFTLLVESPGGDIHDTDRDIEVLYATKEGIRSAQDRPADR